MSSDRNRNDIAAAYGAAPIPPTLPPRRPCPVCSGPMLDATERSRRVGEALLKQAACFNFTACSACSANTAATLNRLPAFTIPPWPLSGLTLDTLFVALDHDTLSVEQVAALGSAFYTWSGVYCPTCEGAEREVSHA